MCDYSDGIPDDMGMMDVCYDLYKYKSDVLVGLGEVSSHTTLLVFCQHSTVLVMM
jgi:hypothetical protein